MLYRLKKLPVHLDSQKEELCWEVLSSILYLKVVEEKVGRSLSTSDMECLNVKAKLKILIKYEVISY